MPHVLVVTDSSEQSEGTVVYRERIARADLSSDHFCRQLAERVGWAALDAEQVERDQLKREAETLQ